mmetsp:Transcript_21467/g.53577  ORF Transcript_21467/g.53577 Transcript_21467/m.53577 type:complete len:205 (+) Transcript_21467:714-1328(+)
MAESRLSFFAFACCFVSHVVSHSSRQGLDDPSPSVSREVGSSREVGRVEMIPNKLELLAARESAPVSMPVAREESGEGRTIVGPLLAGEVGAACIPITRNGGGGGVQSRTGGSSTSACLASPKGVPLADTHAKGAAPPPGEESLLAAELSRRPPEGSAAPLRGLLLAALGWVVRPHAAVSGGGSLSARAAISSSGCSLSVRSGG